MLEPRRLAVRSSASRMAELLGEKVGKRIGYQIKMDSKQSSETKILVITEGILTRKLQEDPSLENVALIIFDEFHERSLHADLSLALTLESQTILRSDLKILVMSATLNTPAISKLLNNAPIIRTQGRSFPVKSIYLEPNISPPSKKELPFYIHRLLLNVLKKEEGNVLVFLAGVREIKSIEKLLRQSELKDTYISTLYGNLNKEAQDKAIKTPPKGFRKIVLSTNIAQTSLTIEGIKIVIDSGLHNVSIFNPFSGMNKLETQFISQDSSTQRAGRAGRLTSGKAYHLWHKSKILLTHDVPEILQTDLTQFLLELALWGNSDITSLPWMDLPPNSALKHAKNLLYNLGILDKNYRITTHGKAVSKYPMHPRLAHTMIKAKALNLGYEASLLSVLISEKDFYSNSFHSSDLKERVITLHKIRLGTISNHSSINIKQAHHLLKHVKQIEKEQNKELNSDFLPILLAFAYPDRIALQRNMRRGNYLLANGKSAILHQDDELFSARFLVVSDILEKNNSHIIYKAMELTLDQIDAHLQDHISNKTMVEWNEEELRVEVKEVQSLGAITLCEKQIHNSASEEVLEIIIEELENVGLKFLKWNKKSISLKNRVNFLNTHEYDFPNFSDNYLSTNMDKWLAPYLININNLKACQQLDLHKILLAQMDFQQIQKLNKLAPEKIEVASGSHIFIDYSNSEQPILAVRLQEMFGTENTPTILKGKVDLMIHLLSPALRPMQITQDLKSFWLTTYDEVKKELRGKYKKHYWPDNPLDAQATSKSKKQMLK